MRAFAIAGVFWFGAFGLGMLCSGQPLTGSQGGAAQKAAQKIDITVERNDGHAWTAVPPGFVFKKGDHLRFQFRANFDGYLYVMNYGTSGQYTSLFPREETGTENRVKGGANYSVPATGASFKIDGPPGFDAVYWVMSPLPLGNPHSSSGSYVPLPPPPPGGGAPQNMKPRCDDTMLHARGLCIDSSAGPKTISPDEKLPENLSGFSRAQSRDIVILNQQQGTSIASPTPIDGPVLYKFLVAHE